ncbi:hypothetical protein ACFQRB_19945 [Halobaculum litoreum]|uniref:Secreted protein n=1 Tax=Halobaculum litoreum TaxID=3031998 RepID=A0ABD5XSQ2_9EURY
MGSAVVTVVVVASSPVAPDEPGAAVVVVVAAGVGVPSAAVASVMANGEKSSVTASITTRDPRTATVVGSVSHDPFA